MSASVNPPFASSVIACPDSFAEKIVSCPVLIAKSLSSPICDIGILSAPAACDIALSKSFAVLTDTAPSPAIAAEAGMMACPALFILLPTLPMTADTSSSAALPLPAVFFNVLRCCSVSTISL